MVPDFICRWSSPQNKKQLYRLYPHVWHARLRCRLPKCADVCQHLQSSDWTCTEICLYIYIYIHIYIYLYMCEPFTSPIVSCARLHCVYFCHKITSDGNQLIQNFIYTILFQTALRHELWRRKSKHGFVRSLPQFQSQISSLKMVGFSSNPHQIPIQPPSSPIEPPFSILHHADIINPPNTYAAKEQRRNRHLRWVLSPFASHVAPSAINPEVMDYNCHRQCTVWIYIYIHIYIYTYIHIYIYTYLHI